MKNENKAKRNYKDSVFVDLFSKCDEAKENFISLYNALHGTNLAPDDTEIRDVSLEQTVYNGRYPLCQYRCRVIFEKSCRFSDLRI